MLSIVKICSRHFPVPASINFAAQTFRHVVRKNPLLHLVHSVRFSLQCQLPRITYRVRSNKYDVKIRMAAPEFAQCFQFRGTILTVKRPQDENERLTLPGSKKLCQASLSKRTNIFCCNSYLHTTQHECENNK